MRDDQELEKLLHGYVEEYLRNTTAARELNELLLAAGVGLRPVIDHMTFRTRNVDRCAEEFVRFWYEHTETIEYGNWFAKVYRRDGYPTLFIDQAFPKPRGEGCNIPEWVDAFGDRCLHHIGVEVDNIEKAAGTLQRHGVEFAAEIIGRHGGPLRQLFSIAEDRGGRAFTRLELVERHYGFKGFTSMEARKQVKPMLAGVHSKAA